MKQWAPLKGCFAEVLLSHGRTMFLSSRFLHLDILRKLCKQFGTDFNRASHADAMLERTQNLGAWQRRGTVSKNVDHGHRRHIAVCPVVTKELSLGFGNLCGRGTM